MSNLDIAIRKQVPTVPQALKALAAMEQQLTAAKTYEDLRRVIKEASALKVLMNDVAEVKAAAENAILLGNKRIAEELRKVPKAGGPGRGKDFPRRGSLYPERQPPASSIRRAHGWASSPTSPTPRLGRPPTGCASRAKMPRRPRSCGS